MFAPALDTCRTGTLSWVYQNGAEVYRLMRVDIGKIRRLRETARLTQSDMAKALGYKTHIGYHYLETGRCRISAEQLGVIAQKLNVPIADLLVADEAGAREVAGS